MTESITFVIPVADDEVLKNNFLSSPIFTGKHKHEIIIQRGFISASTAYNSAIKISINDLVVFAHQDVILPESWVSRLEESIIYLENKSINWGVLGCYGVRAESGKGIGIGKVYTHGVGIHGQEIVMPENVDTLDEIVLVIRKSSGLLFNPTLPNYHLYGTDICLSAREKGLKIYVIPTFCIHNTNQLLILPKEYFACYWHIKKRWIKYLPIFTSCIMISRFNRDLVLRRFHDTCMKILRRKTVATQRVENPMQLIEQIPKLKSLFR
jgi:hypothetical protein